MRELETYDPIKLLTTKFIFYLEHLVMDVEKRTATASKFIFPTLAYMRDPESKDVNDLCTGCILHCAQEALEIDGKKKRSARKKHAVRILFDDVRQQLEQEVGNKEVVNRAVNFMIDRIIGQYLE